MNLKKFSAQVGVYFLVVAAFIGATWWGSRAVSVISQQLPIERKNTIVIDPGHGGVDGGATSCTGILESQFNLEISLRLNDMLHLLGYNTVMIRSTDISVYTEGETIAAKKVSDLKYRVSMVNNTENAILVSIHQNTFSDSRYSGAQVFYGSEGTSRQLAESLQSALIGTINPGSSRKAKKADGIYLMEHIGCTGILVECGFLSNQAEEAQLRNEEYQKKLCAVIATSVGNFLDH